MKRKNTACPVFRGIKAYRGGGLGGKPAVVAVGTFDGVHIGHQRLIETIVSRAALIDALPVILTFEPHPREVLGSAAAQRLTSGARKERLLAGLGAGALVILEFNSELASEDAVDFVERYLVRGIGAREVHVGFNFRFGKKARGTTGLLRKLGAKHGFSLHALEPVAVGGETVSSSRIRSLVSGGRVEEAAGLLGRPYRIEGLVVHGEGRGRSLGFPTANIEPSDRRKLLPAFGVYICRTGPEPSAPALVNIGLSPTFGPRDFPRVEVYLPGSGYDFYGRHIWIDLIEWLRPEKHFNSCEELIDQLRRDVRSLQRKTETLPARGRSIYQENNIYDGLR